MPTYFVNCVALILISDTVGKMPYLSILVSVYFLFSLLLLTLMPAIIFQFDMFHIKCYLHGSLYKNKKMYIMHYRQKYFQINWAIPYL